MGYFTMSSDKGFSVMLPETTTGNRIAAVFWVFAANARAQGSIGSVLGLFGRNLIFFLGSCFSWSMVVYSLWTVVLPKNLFHLVSPLGPPRLHEFSGN